MRNANEHIDDRTEDKRYHRWTRLTDDHETSNQLENQRTEIEPDEKRDHIRMIMESGSDIRKVFRQWTIVRKTRDRPWNTSDTRNNSIRSSDPGEIPRSCHHQRISGWDTEKRMDKNQ